jgi:hypothetical protein
MAFNEQFKRLITLRWPILKAAVFGLSWFLLPFWLFLLVAFYLYFVPVAQSGSMIVPFAALLVLSAVEPVTLWGILIFGAMFFYVLLIKDLLLIDRKSAYEMLVFAVVFFLLKDFYMKLGGEFGGWTLFYSFLCAAAIGLLMAGFIGFSEEKGTSFARLRRPTGMLIFLLSWQFLIAGLFLPTDFIYQSVIVFVAEIPLIDLVPACFSRGLTRAKALVASSAVLSMLVIALASSRWTL